ncbi:phenylalanine--tRNA ligase subunit beta [Flavobacteriales bacterium]|nr:phenylalanine--tRNA ligase subunit beta [Flavobacteriales bacterium]
MKVSMEWLTRWLPLTGTTEVNPQEVSDILTASGLEVEGLEEMPAVPGGLKGMTVGEVLTCAPHPNADRLRVTTVDVGGEAPLNIVCGAPNVAAGQKVIVAGVGSVCHPLEGEPFKIKKGKIRGEVSEGMICAEDELGIGQSHDGILVLDEGLQAGSPAAAALGLESDHCIEIGLTPNRTDAMGHRGVARDLRAAWKWNGRDGQGKAMPPLEPWPSSNLALGSGPISLKVDDPEGAPCYLGVTLQNVQVGPSPEWMQHRLRTIGIEPKNNVVDITNYVLHDLGQPLHAFDADRIGGKTVVVRKAKEGEQFQTLDHQDLTLSSADLVIADDSKPMCLAGIYGGASSGVTESTKRVFLESAWFEPVTVRKSAKRHTLSTDASFRFERGVDPETPRPGLELAVSLLIEHAGAQLDGGMQSFEGDLPSGSEVRLDWAYVDKLIGVPLDRDRIRGILGDLDITASKEDQEGLQLTVPAYRRDVTRPADVVEEILRIHGYDHIPLPGRMKVSLSDRPQPDPEVMRKEWSGILVGRGFHETMHNSLVPAGHASLISDETLDKDASVVLLNPLSSELDAMRQTLIFQGLETISRNRNHQHPDLSLFEFGKVYRQDGDGGHVERERLNLMVTGRPHPESWRGQEGDGMSFLKGAVDAILTRCGLDGVRRSALPSGELFKEGVLLEGKGGFKARLGQIHPTLTRQFDVDAPVFCADLPVDGLLKGTARTKVTSQPLSRFPWVRRDLSLLVPEGMAYAEIEAVVRQTAGKLFRSVNLFDVYTDQSAGTTSYAIAIQLQDAEKTLQDKAIDKTIQRVRDQLSQRLGVTMR